MKKSDHHVAKAKRQTRAAIHLVDDLQAVVGAVRQRGRNGQEAEQIRAKAAKAKRESRQAYRTLERLAKQERRRERGPGDAE